MAKMKIYDWIAYWLVVLGAVNWGFTAFGFNLVEKLIGLMFSAGSIPFAWITSIIYILVGIAGLFAIYTGIKLITK